MSENTFTKIMKRVGEELKIALQDQECASLSIFVNCEGVRVEKTTRTAKSLKESCISMRNIKGDWIVSKEEG